MKSVLLLVIRVAAEEGIGLPAGTGGIVGGVHEKAADNFFVERSGSEIFGLAQVVGRRVVAVGEPVFENLLFGRAEHKAVVHFDGGNAFDDEAVLVAANEAIAKRFLIGNGSDAEGGGDRSGAITEVGFFEAFYFEKFERNDGEKHVDVDVGDDGFDGDGWPRGEIARAEEAFFLAGDEDEEKRAGEFFWMGVETGGDVEEKSAARGVVHCAVVEAVAIDGSTDAEMIEMSGENDEFIFEGGIGAGEFRDEVG